MPAPKGNKYAVGNPNSGAPGRDRVEMADRLVTWAKLSDSTTLLGFVEWYYDQFKDFACIDTLIRWAREDEVFRRAYNYVKVMIGRRREQMLNEGKLHKSAYDFTRQLYDQAGKAEMREQMEYEASLQAGQSSVDAATIANTVAVLNQINKAQTTRKKASKSKSTECKS